jgi:hypothetical protein
MKVSKENTIRTEHKKLQGETQFQSFEVIVPIGVGVYNKDVSFPFDVNLIRGRWFNKQIFAGDSLEMVVAEDTIIGAITSNVAIDDTVINVSQTVVDNTKKGYYIKCVGQDWGRVVNIDNDALTITIESAATAAITATGSEYILQSVKYVPHLYLEGSDTMMVLEGGVGSSFLPANTVVKIKYHNDTGTAKTYSAIFEYFY